MLFRPFTFRMPYGNKYFPYLFSAAESIAQSIHSWQTCTWSYWIGSSGIINYTIIIKLCNNINIGVRSTLDMTGGNVENGEATNGGNIYFAGTCDVKLQGGNISGGVAGHNNTAAKNAGNVMVDASGTYMSQRPCWLLR